MICQQCGAPVGDDDRFCRSCGAVLRTDTGGDPLIGKTIRGTYFLQEMVGVGGMGRVYRAEQTSLGRTVAIKVVHPHLLSDEQTVARFYTEAKAASRLNHPGSVSIIDFGQTEDGMLYLVMEYLRGRDLATVLHEEDVISDARIVHILGSVLDALAEAHALGVVHRDLKPENVILSPLRSGIDLVKVVDFGLATVIAGPDSSPSVTRPGSVCGTPDYMPPEQAKGEGVDARGDLYAVGVMLYEMLTGSLPYEDDTPTKVVLRHINDPIPDPREHSTRPVHPQLADICIKALAKQREMRFASAKEMGDALRDALGSHSQATCPACGARNAVDARFCGTCGHRIQRAETYSQASLKPSYFPPVSTHRAFVGREFEVAHIEDIHRHAERGTTHLHVYGDVGVGKTRLLREIADLFAAQGDLTVGAGPAPFDAPVPYFPIERFMRALAGVGSISELQDRREMKEGIARAGLRELLHPSARTTDSFPIDRSEAVTHALAVLIQRTRLQSQSGRVLLILDDFSSCDPLSRKVIRSLVDSDDCDGLLLITADVYPVDSAEHALRLEGIHWAQAAQWSNATSLNVSAKGKRILPLFLEQLDGRSATDDTNPPRLADAIAQRIDRLPIDARRAIQALAAFGGSASPRDIEKLARLRADSVAAILEREGLVVKDGDLIEITHPFVTRLIEAFIPRAARIELHTQILNLLTTRNAPIELQAEHAYRANIPMRTLMILETAGDSCAKRGDPEAATSYYARAQEIARREMLEDGDTMLGNALISFSRKLAEVLLASGDLARADGVAREALDATAPNESSRIRLLLLLGQIAVRRDRPRDAMRLFGQALDLCESPECSSEDAVHLAIAQLRTDEGDLHGGIQAFERARTLSRRTDGVSLRASLGLAETLWLDGQVDAALRVLAEIEPGLEEHTEAKETLLSLRGRFLAAGGDLPAAHDCFRRAREIAFELGDVDVAKSLQEALDTV